jgi:hypothetical protein
VRTRSRVLLSRPVMCKFSRTAPLTYVTDVMLCSNWAMPFHWHRPSALTVISGHALLTTTDILPRIRWSAIDRYQVIPHGLWLVRELIDVVSDTQGGIFASWEGSRCSCGHASESFGYTRVQYAIFHFRDDLLTGPLRLWATIPKAPISAYLARTVCVALCDMK